MKKLKILFLIGLTYTSNCFANLTGDSVMSPENNTSSNNINNPAGNLALPSYTTLNQNEVQYGTCPAGFNYNGSSQYPLQMRTLSNYYLGGNYVGQSQSKWYDTDASCNATQYQTIACPTGFTGNEYQSRTASTRDGKSYDYSSWYTYSSNCVYVPPVTCKFKQFGYMVRIDIDVKYGEPTQHSFYINGTNKPSYKGTSTIWNGFYPRELMRSDTFHDGGDSGNTIGYSNYYVICGPF